MSIVSVIVVVALVAVLVLVLVARRRGEGGSNRAAAHLLQMTYGDAAQAERLIAEELRRTPTLSQQEAAARAARRLKRDRAR